MQTKRVNPIRAALSRACAASEFAICVLVLVVASAALAPYRSRAGAAAKPTGARPAAQRNAGVAGAPATFESMPSRGVQGDQQ